MKGLNVDASLEIVRLNVVYLLVISGGRGSFRAIASWLRTSVAPPPVNIFTSTFPNQFINREGEAPAEPLRRQLGRSLALPLFFIRFSWQRCLQAKRDAPPRNRVLRAVGEALRSLP